MMTRRTVAVLGAALLRFFARRTLAFLALLKTSTAPAATPTAFPPARAFALAFLVTCCFS
jgi:hypothetical protein